MVILNSFYGIRNDCCTDKNIRQIDMDKYQCVICERIFFKTHKKSLEHKIVELEKKLEKLNNYLDKPRFPADKNSLERYRTQFYDQVRAERRKELDLSRHSDIEMEKVLSESGKLPKGFGTTKPKTKPKPRLSASQKILLKLGFATVKENKNGNK